MSNENEQNNVADIMNAFASGSQGGDEEILKIASDYALQINPAQISSLLKLKMFAIDNWGQYPHIMEKVEKFTHEYLTMKKFHESGMFIRTIIADLSLKKVIPNDAVKVNVMKQ